MTASTKRAKPPTMMRQGKPIKAFSPFSRGLGRRPAALLSAILMLTAGGRIEFVRRETLLPYAMDTVKAVGEIDNEGACRMPTRDEGHSAVYIRSSRNAEIAGNHIDPKAQGEGFRRAFTLGEDCETSTVRIADP